jgi:UDP-glucose 4-epimerase
MTELCGMKNSGPVLIIGATGMIGSAAAAALAERGVNTRVLLRPGSNSCAIPDERHQYVTGDLTTGQGLGVAVAGVRAVLYFASMSVPAVSANDPSIDFAASLPPVVHVLNAMVSHAGDARFLFPSSGGAIYGSCARAACEQTPVRPLSAYALGKAVVEQTLRFYDDVFKLRSDVLRISNVYGSAVPRKTPQGVIDRFLDDAIGDRVSQVWGSVDIERDYVFVDDVVSAVLAVLAKPQKESSVLNVGNSQSHSLERVLEIIARVTNGQHRFEVVPNQYQGVRRSLLDCGLIGQLLGWKPSVTLEEGIARAWARKNQR